MTKPSSNIETLQTLTMWSQNKTLEWFESEAEKRDIMEKARKNVGKMKDKYKERRLVEDRRRNCLRNKRKKRK